MAKQKRFEVLLNETPNGGMMMATVIIRDTVTGVLYLQLVNGYGGGLTPLLDADGKPIVWNDGDALNGML
ncbi:MAG TPA: hypothetical protein IAA56_07375 [Candidatus Galloscillospira excrementavium]|nr:hypothetical protein [Candidatus Galloscillospira excrementavium]